MSVVFPPLFWGKQETPANEKESPPTRKNVKPIAWLGCPVSVRESLLLNRKNSESPRMGFNAFISFLSSITLRMQSLTAPGKFMTQASLKKSSKIRGHCPKIIDDAIRVILVNIIVGLLWTPIDNGILTILVGVA